MGTEGQRGGNIVQRDVPQGVTQGVWYGVFELGLIGPRESRGGVKRCHRGRPEQFAAK